jgi:hypothetical protein
MINNIEIRIKDYTNMDINIVPSTLKVYVKDQEKNIDKDTIDRLLSIICMWEHEYFNDKILDAPTCRVKIFTDTGVEEFFMMGEFPKTYKEFYDIVSDIYG